MVARIMPTSNSVDSVLARVANRNDGETITGQALAEWLSSGECPPYDTETAAWSILELITKADGWESSGLVHVMQEIHRPPEKGQDKEAEGEADYTPSKSTFLPFREPSTSARIVLDPSGESAIVQFVGRMISSNGKVTDTDETFSIVVSFSDMLALWNSSPIDERPRDGFPLEILYLAWVKRPKLVSPSTRATGRIIPGKLAQVAPGDRQAGKLFTLAAHVAHVAPEAGDAPGQMVFSGLQQPEVAKQQFVLPGFKESTAIGPCLPLALYDLGDAPATSRGPAAPYPSGCSSRRFSPYRWILATHIPPLRCG